jgi:hypothetical protein
MSDSTKFWMVIRHDGRTPVVRHETLQDAEAEAERLCKKETSTFFVLEAVSKHSATVINMRYTLHEPVQAEPQ